MEQESRVGTDGRRDKKWKTDLPVQSRACLFPQDTLGFFVCASKPRDRNHPAMAREKSTAHRRKAEQLY
jgi:hypothetical protein